MNAYLEAVGQETAVFQKPSFLETLDLTTTQKVKLFVYTLLSAGFFVGGCFAGVSGDALLGGVLAGLSFTASLISGLKVKDLLRVGYQVGLQNDPFHVLGKYAKHLEATKLAFTQYANSFAENDYKTARNSLDEVTFAATYARRVVEQFRETYPDLDAEERKAFDAEVERISQAYYPLSEVRVVIADALIESAATARQELDII